MDRVTAIYNRYGAQVEKALQEDENPFSKVPTWDDVVALDPSPRKKRLDWVCQMISRRRLREEDFYKIPEALADFERLQPVLRREGFCRDINAYKTPQWLFATLDHFLGQFSQRELSRAERARIDAETIVLADTPALKVVEPKTMAAAQYWGRCTRLCTSATESDNAFDDYTKNGEHIVIYRFADGSAIQTCSNGDMTDQHDSTIPSWDAMDDNKRALMLSTPALREAAVQQDGLAIQFIPADQQTERVRELAVQQEGLAIQCIPPDQRTERVKAIAAGESVDPPAGSPGHTAKIPARFHLSQALGAQVSFDVSIDPVPARPHAAQVRGFCLTLSGGEALPEGMRQPRFNGNVLANGVAKIEHIDRGGLAPGQRFGALAVEALLSLDAGIEQVWMVPVENEALRAPATDALQKAASQSASIPLNEIAFGPGAVGLVKAMVNAGVTELEVAYEDNSGSSITLKGRAPGGPQADLSKWSGPGMR